MLLDAPVSESLDASREIGRLAASTRVVVLGFPGSDTELIAFAEAGVAGYVTPHDSVHELAATVMSVAHGELPCSPRMAGVPLGHVAALAAERALGSSEARLTSRELQVVRLIDEGLSNKAIADRLCIELTSVKNHVHRILAKLEVATRSEAVARVRTHGLLEAGTIVGLVPPLVLS